MMKRKKNEGFCRIRIIENGWLGINKKHFYNAEEQTGEEKKDVSFYTT